jgi:hypothetical protein
MAITFSIAIIFNVGEVFHFRTSPPLTVHGVVRANGRWGVRGRRRSPLVGELRVAEVL